MPTAVAAARQSYADHPMVRLETAPPGPCHAVSLQDDAFWDFHRMRDCNTQAMPFIEYCCIIMYVSVIVYVASRKAAAMLGLHPQTLRRYANRKAKSPTIGTPLANAYTTLTPICAEQSSLPSCATAGSVPPSS